MDGRGVDAGIEEGIKETYEQIRNNFFPTDRGLRRRTRKLPEKYRTSYLNVLGKYLMEKLAALGPDDVWIDVGGGELFAALERITLPEFKGLPLPTICVISVESPDTDDFRENKNMLEILGDKFIYMEGRRIEDIPLQEIPKATIITDVYGAMGFSAHVDETLRRELELLEPHGVLLTTMDKVFIWGYGTPHIGRQYVNKGGYMGRRRYASEIGGARLLPHKTKFGAIILERTAGPLYVPELELVEFVSYRRAPNPKGLPETMINCERYYRLKDRI